MSTEPALMSLTAVAKAIADKQVSSQEVTRSCLQRIAQWQPRINAFMSVETDAALKAAGEADAELAKDKSRGPLHGVPLAHKDMYYDAGHVVTCGSQHPPRFRADRHVDGAATVEGRRLAAARLAADGGVRLWSDRTQLSSRRGA